MKMKFKYLFTFLGYFINAGAIISFLVLSFIVTVSKGENFSRDLLGFPIPQSPGWTSFIPYLGMFISFIFESFSIHGLVQFGIMIGMIAIGSFLVGLGKEKNKTFKTISNSKSEKRNLKSFLENYIKQNLDYELPVVLGDDDFGSERFADLSEIGHILISGQQGAGKTKFGHTLIATLLLLKPDEIKFLLLDLKGFEFSQYAELPNRINKKVDNINDAFLELEKLEIEHNRRINNEKDKAHTPFIIVLIESFSGLILSDKSRFERIISKITKNSDKSHIHIVMWDSRLVHEVFTPIVKSSFPMRIAFKLPYSPNSTLIMDDYDEMKLSNSEDVLMIRDNLPTPIHLKPPTLTDDETRVIVKNVKQ